MHGATVKLVNVKSNQIFNLSLSNIFFSINSRYNITAATLCHIFENRSHLTKVIAFATVINNITEDDDSYDDESDEDFIETYDIIASRRGALSRGGVTDYEKVSGIIVKGNDIVPVDTIRANVMQAGFRDGSVIYGDVLKTSKREVSLQDALQTAQEFATQSTVPGTSVMPITAADVQVDKNTGVVTVTVIEDFSSVELENDTRSG